MNYPVYCLPILRRKAEKILALIGVDLEGAETTDSNIEHWPQYVQMLGFKRYLVAGPTLPKPELGLSNTMTYVPDRNNQIGLLRTPRQHTP